MMTKLKYLLAFILISGILFLGYAVWFLKYFILAGIVIYAIYRIDKGYKRLRTKLKLRKEK